MKQSKYVTDWWVEIINKNIYCLTFNLTHRWLAYHKWNDTMYSFAGINDDISLEDVHEIPEFLPKLEKGMYIPTVIQEKDKLSYYFIPIMFESRRKRNIILEGKIEL